MENLNYDQALALYEAAAGEVFEPILKKTLSYGICSDCNTAMLDQNGLWICTTCNTTQEMFVSHKEDNVPKKNNFYYRRLYFIEKMNLLVGYKTCNTEEYKKLISLLSRYKFKTIKDLRKIMKRLGTNKFYKYIYNIFYDIRKVRLVSLTSQQIQQLSIEFVAMETFFKQNREVHNRKNIFPYSAIIYMLLKKHKIDGYNKILLPRDNNKVINKIKLNCQ